LTPRFAVLAGVLAAALGTLCGCGHAPPATALCASISRPIQRPSIPCFSSRRFVGRAAARPAPLRAVRGPGRPRAAAAGSPGTHSQPRERRSLGRRPHDRVSPAPGVRWSDGTPVTRPTCSSRCARFSIRASRSVSRRLRARRPGGRAGRAHGRLSPASRVGAGSSLVLLVRCRASVRAAGSRSARRAFPRTRVV